ncbi:tRNA-dihydrouridine synthase family protein [Pseudodesulfovibrio sp. JC047]|uniref:tRNA dihydrouridine synthase n=1 Tax=Pseudodesulfovibrio sp. JC047 TaxID=2683199 RepID=UPI0013D4699B|nr:tRNA-dihydrouridine synthase family protein [Pseudodesulfovibrio sp. JC047]NDV20622.1 tRNA-dihydrouridine synthase family protein [Pseudodesulfovibrio sp. JC047]
MKTMDETHIKRLAELLNRPLQIRGKEISNRLWLAPLAGLGHAAYRDVLDSYGGCGLMFTEMCSARSVPTEKPSVSPTFRWRKEELGHLVCQIFGSTPEEMIPAARRIEAEGFFGIDINMGCTAPGIVKRNAGAGLLKNPDAAIAAVKSVRQTVSIPVFVKFRTGWTPDIGPAVELAQRFEAEGVDCLVFHPRVAPDKRTKPPVKEHIKAISDAVSIPVFGNGDVVLPEECLSMLENTGCAGVSIGRMAIARPWLFAEWTTGYIPLEGCFQEYAMKLADAIEANFDPIRALKRFKMFTIYFAANFTYGHSLQTRFLGAKSMDDVREIIRNHVKPNMRLTLRPNMNLYSI